jgi:Xaa-Pro aminopeptidase
VWEPEERPFLMIVQPLLNQTSGDVTANVTFLAPHFEVERVRLLGMPFLDDEVKIVPWEEHWNPYATLRNSWGSDEDPKVMVDEEMRDFIQRGLAMNGFAVVGLGGEVEAVRQRKTGREIEILRAVNTGTVEAARAMRRCMYPGLMENEVVMVLDETIRAGGMEPFFDIVLFGKDIHIFYTTDLCVLINIQMKMLRIHTEGLMEVKSWKQNHSFLSMSGR